MRFFSRSLSYTASYICAWQCLTQIKRILIIFVCVCARQTESERKEFVETLKAKKIGKASGIWFQAEPDERASKSDKERNVHNWHTFNIYDFHIFAAHCCLGTGTYICVCVFVCQNRTYNSEDVANQQNNICTQSKLRAYLHLYISLTSNGKHK